MTYTRGISSLISPCFLLMLVVFLSACGGDDGNTEDSTDGTVAIQLPETEAGTVLASALSEARETNRLVFAHTGADW